MEPDRTPSFFTTMVESSTVVRIPQMFLHFLREDFSSIATLVRPSGHTWAVKAKRSNGQIKLKKGWQKFCLDNSIGQVDVLLFSYEGYMRFCVEIFEPSGMKKKVRVPSSASWDFAEKTTHGDSSKCFMKMENPDQGNTSSGDDRVELDRYLTDPKNPYLEIEVKKIKGNKLFFSRKFLREHGVELASVVTYSDPAGRELKGKFGEWSDGRVYVTGWRTFVNCNKLEMGDKCVIELVIQPEGASGKICSHMNVHIVATRQGM